jgi:CRP/FNR family transcriptional regulator, cyclic AMP receptor protein
MSPNLNIPLHGLSADARRTIAANRWFASLTSAQQLALLNAAKPMEVKDGHFFSRQNLSLVNGQDGFAVVTYGLLKISSAMSNGREAILSYVRPGQWLGELAVLDGGMRERDYVSVGKTQLLSIDHEAMQVLLQDAALARRITDLLATRTRAWLALLEDFALRSTLSRTARRLLMLAYDDESQSGSPRNSIDVSQDALASMLGLTRQSVANQLRELSNRGAIAQAYGRVNISSIVALMAEAAAA